MQITIASIYVPWGSVSQWPRFISAESWRCLQLGERTAHVLCVHEVSVQHSLALSMRQRTVAEKHVAQFNRQEVSGKALNTHWPLGMEVGFYGRVPNFVLLELGKTKRLL